MSSEAADGLLRRAAVYFDRGELAEAGGLARLLVREIDPGLAAAHAMLARISQAHGRLALAVGHAGRAARAAPDDAARRRELVGALDFLAAHNGSPPVLVAGARHLLDRIDGIKKEPPGRPGRDGVVVLPATRPTALERRLRDLAAALALPVWTASEIAAAAIPAGATLILAGGALIAENWAFRVNPGRVIVPVDLTDLVAALGALGVAGSWRDARLDLAFATAADRVVLGAEGTVLPRQGDPDGLAAAKRYILGT